MGGFVPHSSRCFLDVLTLLMFDAGFAGPHLGGKLLKMVSW